MLPSEILQRSHLNDQTVEFFETKREIEEAERDISRLHDKIWSFINVARGSIAIRRWIENESKEFHLSTDAMEFQLDQLENYITNT